LSIFLEPHFTEKKINFGFVFCILALLVVGNNIYKISRLQKSLIKIYSKRKRPAIYYLNVTFSILYIFFSLINHERSIKELDVSKYDYDRIKFMTVFANAMILTKIVFAILASM